MSPIAIVDSTSQTHTVLVSLNNFDLIDVDFSWSFSWTLKKGPKIDWPPWVTRVRELKHLGVHVLQLKDGDPYLQARADRKRGALQAWPARTKIGLWSDNAHCAQQHFIGLCDLGLIQVNPEALVTVIRVISHLSVQSGDCRCVNYILRTLHIATHRKGKYIKFTTLILHNGCKY